MPNNLALQLTNLHYAFVDDNGKKFVALDNISLEVRTGELVCLIGPSGSGKSTLLRLIAGLLKPTAGTIELVSPELAMVFQNFAIFPWLTVSQNIEYGLKMAGMNRRERQKMVREKIAEVGLHGFEQAHPRELSGGMRQRVGLARALALNPKILLMDEPFSSVDSLTAEKLRAELLAIWERYRMTIIMVTHLVEEAVELADRVVVVSDRPTRVKSEHQISLPRPRNTRTPDFFSLVDKIKSEIG